jgi:hypothetical protein
MTESWIDAYVEYRRMVVDEKRKSALAHAIYPTAFGFGGGPVTDYGPNTANTWAAQGLRALDRVREILE